MPFVTLEDVRPFLPEGLNAALAKEDFFDQIENEAAVFINANYGLEIPIKANNAPAYIKRPIAMLIQKFARYKVQNINSENFETYNSMIDKEFDWACNYLAERTSASVTTGIGTISGVESW